MVRFAGHIWDQGIFFDLLYLSQNKKKMSGHESQRKPHFYVSVAKSAVKHPCASAVSAARLLNAQLGLTKSPLPPLWH